MDDHEVVIAVDAPSEDALAALVAPQTILRTWRVDRGRGGARRGPRLHAAHRDAYAGSWFEWSGEHARMTLGFTRDVERHRAHLAPAIDVEPRARSIRELEQVSRSAYELIGELPEITAPMSRIDDRENAVLIDVVAKPEAAARAAAALRARFGDAARITVIAEDPTVAAPALFHHYSVDATGCVLTVFWNSGNCTPLPLEVTEADDHVAVRVIERWSVGPIPAYARGQRASAPLRSRLGGRAVIDATTGQRRPRA